MALPRTVRGGHGSTYGCCEKDSRDQALETNSLSEEELLNITFETCGHTNRGEVLASAVLQCLQAMTGQSSDQDQLTVLHHMLDPEGRDPPVSKETFHSTMRKWIAQCRQDGMLEDRIPTSGPEYTQPDAETSVPERNECHCDPSEVQALLLELRHAHGRLREQNSSLMKTISQTEDLNLQLTVEMTDLQTRLASAELTTMTVHSLSEELDNARQSLKESQEKMASAQALKFNVVKESQRLKLHIKIIEDKNEKLTLEKSCAENHISNLRKAYSETREELDEALFTVTVREKEIVKKNMLIDKLKKSHSENFKIIQGLQTELQKLRGHHWQKNRADRQSVGLRQPLKGSESISNHNSLFQEIQDIQMTGALDEGVSPLCGALSSMHIIHRIKSPDIDQQLHAQLSDKDSVDSCHSETLERSSKQQLMSLLCCSRLRELDAHAQLDEQGCRSSVVSRWCCQAGKGHRATFRWEDPQRGQAEANAGPRIWQFQGPVGVVPQLNSDPDKKADYAEKKTQTWEEEVLRSREVCNVAVTADVQVPVQDTEAQTEPDGRDAADLTQPFRRVEAMVAQALQAAQLIREGERRVMEVREKMEAIGQRVESALSRVVHSDSQLGMLKAKMHVSTEAKGTCTQSDMFDHQHSGGSYRKTSPPVQEPVVESWTSSRSLRVNDRGHANEDGLSGFVGADDISDHKGSETGSAQVNGSGQTPLPLADLSPGHGSPESPLEFPSEGLAVETASVPAEPRPTSAACRDHVAGSEALGCINYDQSQERGQSQPPEDRDTGHPEALELLSHNCPDTGTTRGSDCEERERSQAGVSGRSHVSDRQHSFCTEQVAVEVTLCCGSGPLTDQTSKDCTPHCTPVKSQPPLQSRRRPRLVRVPTMPTLPEEENDSPEEVDSSSSSPTTYTPVESKVVNITLAAPSIILPRPAQSDNLPLDQTRPHSPRPRLSRTSASLGTPITTVDHKGHVIDLVKDQLPELQLSEKDRLKNLELLEEAKKVSDRFLTRRGRRSTCSLSDSPTALSPNLTPCSSPVPSRSSSTSVPPLTAAEVTEPTFPTSLTSLHLEVPSTHEQTDPNKPDQETIRHLEWKPSERRKVSSGTLSPRHTTPSSPHEPAASSCGVLTAVPEKRLKKAASGPEEAPSCWSLGSQASATGVAKPVPRANSQQAPCTAEIKTIGAFPPLMRAVSWDTVGSLAMMNGAQNLSSPQNEDSTFTFPEKARDPPFKSSGYKDFPVPPVNVQKLSKLREEHKLMRNQSISGSKLPDLKETAEQERVQCPPPGSPIDEEAREKADAMPNISDIMLRKLKLHRGLPGCAPPLSEKEVENAFVQLSLAFRNDNYTLETRLRQAERERNLTEENVEKELEEFKGSLKCSASLWQNSEQRETYQRLLETMAVLQRLAVRLSSRAEMVGAVRQEKRMNKATEVMMQYVENLKRTYEKDHAELMEFKKLANQNSNRCYGGSVDTGDDGVPRASRSMSLTMGKALPRRRVSVAVVPKFNLLNIPGQTPATASPAQPPITSPGPPLPVLCETTVKSLDPVIPAVAETGKAVAEQEREEAVAEKPQSSVEEIKAELKAKIEEEAFNKGYQEGLKRSKEVQEVKEQEDKVEEEHVELEKRDEETDKETKSGRYGELLEILDRICPKIFRRSRLLWTSLTFFLTMFLLFNLVSYFSDYSNHGDAPAEKTMSPGKNKLFGLDVGLQAKNPTTE